MNLIRYDRSFSGFVALALVFALIFATSVAEAQVVGQEETLLDFPEPSHPRYACHDQGVIDEYEKITKDAAFYERLARITGEGDSVIPLLWQWIATARFKNGVELARQGKFAEATLLFDMLDQRFARDESAASGARGEVPSPREWAAAALNNKGAVLARQGRFAEAIAVYDDLIERYGKPHYNEEILAWREELDKQGVDLSELDPNNSVWIRAAVAAARFNKGLALRQQGRLTEALALYDENFDWQEDGLDDCSCAGKDPEGNFLIWQQRLKAQIGKAGIFEQQEKSEEALDLYDKILRQFAMVQRLYPVIPDMLLQEQMIKVVRKRGEVLGKQGEFEREARTYAYLDEILRPGSNLATRQAVFETLLAWAERSRQRDDQKSEFLAYSSLYTLFRNDEDPVIRGPFAKAMIEMGDELAVKKGFVPIKNVVDDIVEVFNRDKDPAIREQVARAILEWASHDDPMTEESIYEAIYEYFGDDREPAIRALVDQALHRLLEEASRLEYRLEQANRSDPDDPIAAIYGRKILLEQANRSDPDDPGYNIAELRAILEERGKEPAEEPEKVDEAPDAESYGWETE
ncbi:MAG: tetratricopeptide repeat protein, partial [Zoogloeaceae bacterium]|nr:tetratricopeptide repeat protein [Zoogloeaceae bacterium]